MENVRTDDDDVVIPITSVRGDTLQTVIAWCSYHKDDPPVSEEEKWQMLNLIDPKDEELIKADSDSLYFILQASHFLGTPGLVDVAIKILIKNHIKGKTPDKIREALHIRNYM